jgi:hypothetical protein
MDLQNNDHRIFCGANQAQSPHFLLNGKTLKKSNESRVAGKNLKDKRFPTSNHGVTRTTN